MADVKIPQLTGSKILKVRPMTKAELKREGWEENRHGARMAIVLDSGVVLFASSDDEGNGPGAIFGHYKDMGIYVEEETA